MSSYSLCAASHLHKATYGKISHLYLYQNDYLNKVLHFYSLFYQSYLSVSLTKILDQVTDTSRFLESEQSLVFTNTLYKCHDSSILLNIFIASLLGQLCVAAATVGVTVNSFDASITSPSSGSVLIWFLWLLTLILGTVQVTVLLLGLGWSLISRNIQMSQIMRRYSSFLSKIDITRGRAVPSPVEDHKPVQVLPELNPYNTSPDLKLLLDLVSSKSGSGLALRVLAKLEIDFAESWAPRGLQIEEEADTESGGTQVTVYWKDAVVVNYIAGNNNNGPKIHYGLELVETGVRTRTKIISHQEVRFMKQTWRANHPGQVDLGSLEDFIYHETFLVMNKACVTARVWTVLNGQLISFAEKGISIEERKTDVLHSRSMTPRVLHSLGQRRVSLVSRASLENVIQENQDLESTIEDHNDTVKYYVNTNKLGAEKKSSKSSSETNLNFNNSDDDAFSRKAQNRKSLPIGHINLAFISEDDNKDHPYLLI